MALIGLSGNWFFVGRRSAYLLLVLDTFPRVLGMLTGWYLGAHGASLAAMVSAQLIGVLCGALLSAAVIMRGVNASASSVIGLRVLKDISVSQFRFMTGSFYSAVFVALPVMAVSFLSPASLPAFAIVDKVYRQINAGLSPFVNVLQGWVPNADRRVLEQRTRHAMVGTLVFSTLIVVGFAVFGRAIFGYLGVEVGRGPALLAGVLVAAGLIRSTFHLVLIPSQQRTDVNGRASLFTGGIVGLAAIPPFLYLWGASGALVAVVIGLVVTSACMYSTLRGSRMKPKPVAEVSLGPLRR
ncbi:hypothetical protein [Prescottella equi]|uniref:hypothetical protein n=1 Tax=Rhodococcus hoagii TaxID=43767 RepID=UPI001F1C8A53|nr:hypothetical protein [Prescottella equi]